MDWCPTVIESFERFETPKPCKYPNPGRFSFPWVMDPRPRLGHGVADSCIVARVALDALQRADHSLNLAPALGPYLTTYLFCPTVS